MDDVFAVPHRAMLCWSWSELCIVYSKLSMCKWWKIIKMCTFICDETEKHLCIVCIYPYRVPLCRAVWCEYRVYHFQNSCRLIRFGNYENPERNTLSPSLSVCLSFRLCLCAVLCSTANSNGSYSIWCASVFVCVPKTIRQVQVASEMNCKHRKQSKQKRERGRMG